MTEINTKLEEKIDYIYTEMKRNRKHAQIGVVFKWGYRLAILGYLAYFFFVSLPNIIDKIPSFTGNGESSLNMEEIMENPQIKQLYDSYFNK